MPEGYTTEEKSGCEGGVLLETSAQLTQCRPAVKLGRPSENIFPSR